MFNVTCHSPASLSEPPLQERRPQPTPTGVSFPLGKSKSGSACLRGRRKIRRGKLAGLGPQVTHSGQGTPLPCEASGELITTATT